VKKLWITIISTLLILGGGLGFTWWKLTEGKRAIDHFAGDRFKIIISEPKFPGWFEEEFRGVTAFTVIGNRVLNEEDWLLIETFDSIISLRLRRSNTNDLNLKIIGKLTSLVDLNLTRTSVTDIGIGELKMLTLLYSLNLSGTSVTDSGIRELKTLTFLGGLDLSDTNVTRAGVAELQKALPNCKITLE
jgi:hypothetical protein